MTIDWGLIDTALLGAYIQLGREHGDDCQYVFRQFFFVGDVVSLIDNFDIYVVFLTDRLNQLIAETDEPVFVVDDYLAAAYHYLKSFIK
jgi:hypothetical protein